MSLRDLAKADWQKFTTDPEGFGVSIVLVAPTSETITIRGLATKHHIGVDAEGNRVDTKNVHISFSEQPLLDASYPSRNTGGEVDLKGHKATWTDSSGTSVTYIIQQWFPDETMGVILCILGDFE